MKRVLISLILLALAEQNIICQNLVMNPSFECGNDICTWTTPSNIGQFPDGVCKWILPNRGTPDIFSTTVSSSCWTAMPVSNYNQLDNYPIGKQQPHSGSRFAGIFTYSGDLYAPDPSYREYLEVPLTEPLQPGEKYCAEFYVSLAERPRYAANQLGMYFHDHEVNMDDWGGPFSWRGFPLPYTPQIRSNRIILDSIGWTPVVGTFTAVSPATHLIIGNFSGDLQTQAIVKGGHRTLSDYEYAYYFVDDVLVERFREKKIEILGDLLICDNEPTLLSEHAGLSDLKWTTLEDTVTIIGTGSSISVNPKLTTSYLVSGRNCDITLIDTVTVEVVATPLIDLGADARICEGETLTLSPGLDFASYVWQDNSTANHFQVSESGEYSVTVGNEAQCYTTDFINVSVGDIPPLDLGSDTLVCQLPLRVDVGTGFTAYEWSTGEVTSTISIAQSGRYWVKAYSECGVATDTISVQLMNDVFIPNVVTLNDDTLNETLVISKNSELREGGEMTVMNRWGNVIFSSPSYQNEWPSHETTPGTYFYIFKYLGCKRKGWVQVFTDR